MDRVLGRRPAAARDDPAAARRAMVAGLQRHGIRDARVLAAMGTLPREAFLDTRQAPAAYDDRALPIGSGQSISQPYIVARMTELLGVRDGDRILEIGTGSGYQAAILALLRARVRTVERHPSLALAARERLHRLGIEGVDVRVGDGSAGDPDGAPWDGIIVTAAAPAVDGTLRSQVAVGRRVVVPVGEAHHQELMVVERTREHEWREWSDGPVAFVPLVGEAGFSDTEAWPADPPGE